MTWRKSLPTVGLLLVFSSIVGGQTASSPICTVPADVVFALDSSSSIQWQNFNKSLDFVKKIVEKIVVAGPKGIQIGILTFSTRSIVQYHLNAYSTKLGMLVATSSIPYSRGGIPYSRGTNIGSGIKTLMKMFGASNGARENAVRYGVVITDGHNSQGNSTLEADLARAANITLLAVAFGKTPKLSELEGIANKPSAGFVYSVTGYDALINLTDVVQDITDCDNKTEKLGNTRVGEICSKSTKCIPKAECIYDGSNSATTRCRCKYGYVHAVHDGISICATIITTPIEPHCFACESNGGVCYDATRDQMRDGCVCPSFKYETDCQKSHDTYTALRVLRCIASSKATIPDRTAVRLPLVLNSCPSPGQIHITDKNNWKSVSGRKYELRTGLLRMFKLSEGHSVHVHCTVQVCLAGSEADCGEIACTHPAGHASYGRRKRSTSTIFLLSKTLPLYNTKLISKPSTSPKDTDVFSPFWGSWDTL